MTRNIERREREPAPLKIADLFPGQGFKPEELVKTAKGLLDHKVSGEVFKWTDNILGAIFSSGKTLSQVIGNPTEEDLEELVETEIAQPAVLTVSIASLRLFERSQGREEQLPSAITGHSAGMIGALHRASSISFDDAVLLARKRGEAMRDARKGREPGAMAAVINREAIDQQALQDVCANYEVELVNVNSPGQIVISGERDGIAEATREIKAKGLRVVPLPASDAFHHSQLMKSAVNIFSKAVEGIYIKDPFVPIYLNSTGAPLISWGAIRFHLADEIAKPVDWIRVIDNMKAKGVVVFREFGHGNVLTGLVQRINPGANVKNIDSVTSAEQASFQ